jgi:hypothetical protein
MAEANFRKVGVWVRFPILAPFFLCNYFVSNIKLTLKDRLFNTYVFVQLFYSIREIWWGISSSYLHFNLRQLELLVNQVNSITLVLLGVLGIVGAFTKNFLCNTIYSLLNVFAFAGISLTFFWVDPTSSGGGNYAIEALGAIWLAYQISRSSKRSEELERFIKENWTNDGVNKE